MYVASKKNAAKDVKNFGEKPTNLTNLFAAIQFEMKYFEGVINRKIYENFAVFIFS